MSPVNIPAGIGLFALAALVATRSEWASIEIIAAACILVLIG